MKHAILTIDIGGTGLKATVVDATGQWLAEPVRVRTPHPCLPELLLGHLLDMIGQLPPFDRISIGFPGVVRDGRVITAPNLNTDLWANFPLADKLAQALAQRPGEPAPTHLIPVCLVNDADMQGLSLISGQGLEFVVTLGTGVGTAWYRDGELLPHMELGQHPIYDNQTYDQYLGDATRKAIGHKAWQERVERMLKLVELLLRPDRIFLGGGNAVHIPPSADRHIKIGSNDAAFQGGAALWRHVAQSGNNTGSYS